MEEMKKEEEEGLTAFSYHKGGERMWSLLTYTFK
jgi:hypothetical protein